MYQALDLAKYIVDYCYRKDLPITNLILNQMLYLIWIDYYKNYNKLLFKEHFKAFKFGPAVPEVYYEFSSYAGIKICEKYDFVLKETKKDDIETILILNNLIDKYLTIPVYDIISITTKKDGPWDIIHSDETLKNQKIPFYLIVKDLKNKPRIR